MKLEAEVATYIKEKWSKLGFHLQALYFHSSSMEDYFLDLDAVFSLLFIYIYILYI